MTVTRFTALCALCSALACSDPASVDDEADASMPASPDATADDSGSAPPDSSTPGEDASTAPGDDAGSPSPRMPFDEMIPEGFPDSRTTGPFTPLAEMRVHEGDYRTSAAGEVIEAVVITGALHIEHPDVRVRDCRIHGGQFSVVTLRAEGAVIENCELGLEGSYTTLAADVAPGDETISVDGPVPVGAYLLLSSARRSQQTFRVAASAGSGPYELTLERHHVRGGGDETLVTSPPEIAVDHPRGASISIYDPSTMPALPGNGVSGTAQGYTIRACDIHHVNDGFKMRNGLYEDNYVHELIYVPPAHLDAVQSTRGEGAILRHNTLAISLDANGIQLAPNQGPLTDLTFEYNYVSGGGFVIRWGAESGRLAHNRVDHSKFGPITVYRGGALDEARDNRLVDDGSVIGTNGEPGLGDRDGDGTGRADAWGTGYDPAYALPGN